LKRSSGKKKPYQTAAAGVTGSGEREDAGEMSSGSTCREVVLHVYDVTKPRSDSEKANNTVRKINRFFKDGIGVGGIFHSAVQVSPEPAPRSSFPARSRKPWSTAIIIDAMRG